MRLPSPGRNRQKAIRLPSGDQAGAVSLANGSLGEVGGQAGGGADHVDLFEGHGSGGADERDPAVLAAERGRGVVPRAGAGDERAGE
jgi:hypothetical protein